MRRTRLPRVQEFGLIEIVSSNQAPATIHIFCSQGLAQTGQAFCLWVHYPTVNEEGRGLFRYARNLLCPSESFGEVVSPETSRLWHGGMGTHLPREQWSGSITGTGHAIEAGAVPAV